MPEKSPTPLAILPAALAESCLDESYIVVIRTREEFTRWLQNPEPGADLLQVEGLIDDQDAWALAAQGTVPIPLDVVLDDPATEFSSLYRLVDVRNTRPLRVTLPAKPGLMKALRLAVSLSIPVRILPGQPDELVLAELSEAAELYLRDAMVEVPVEFFHSLLIAFCQSEDGTLWSFLEQDPAQISPRDETGHPALAPDFVETHLTKLISDGAECDTCPWQVVCAGYFKHPDPTYDCAGVKQLLASLQSAADELTRDLSSVAP